MFLTTMKQCQCFPYLIMQRGYQPDKCFPIHQLLSVGPLKKTEIPLDILEVLVANFYVNEYNNVRMSCLNIAIEMNTIVQ